MAQAVNSSVADPPLTFGLFRPGHPPFTIGVVGPHYNLERVSYMMDVPGYSFRTVKRLPLHRLSSGSTFWGATPIVLDRSANLLHTWNMLPLNGQFVVSFELELPRYFGRIRNWQHSTGQRLLASDRCASILALSNAALLAAQRRLNTAGHHSASGKLKLFRGAILPAGDDVRNRTWSTAGPLRLLFVGADGLRKGIIPLLDAVKILRERGAEVELTVISQITPVTYVFGDYTPNADAVRQQVIERSGTHYHASMSNSEVRKVMRSQDLLVRPSFDESLGWVLVEAGMEGLGSIVSNVFAFPELVTDGVSGRLISLELNEDRRWTGIFQTGQAQQASIAQANKTLRDGLINAIGSVLNDRSVARRWGEAARQQAERMYHPHGAAAQLKAIYDTAINRQP